MNSYLKAYKQYFDFSSRTSRQDFWLFMLFATLVNLAATVIDAVFFDIPVEEYGPLMIITTLVQFIPSISVAVRRLHDTDRSGYWLFMMLIPLIGFIVLLVMFCKASQASANRFGNAVVTNNKLEGNGHTIDRRELATTIPLDELEKLNKLKQSGAISDDEFAVMKNKLLSSRH